jgi:hypothetical protein
MKRIVLFVLIIGIVFDIEFCTKKANNYKVLESFIIKEQKGELLKDKKWIAYLTDFGCSGCNSRFAAEMVNYRFDKQGLILISASGKVFDISKFKENNTNVMPVSAVEFEELKILSKSGVIFLDNNLQKIDTIIPVEFNNLETGIQYIKNKIRN